MQTETVFPEPVRLKAATHFHGWLAVALLVLGNIGSLLAGNAM
jgi:hypothetical protein